MNHFQIDRDYVKEQTQEIRNRFQKHLDSGLLEVIAPPEGYYPDFNNLRNTLGDTVERVRWRTKQNLDYAYLMMYAQAKGTFYVQLEDDILTKPHYLTIMKNFAFKKLRENKEWIILDFCQLGFIAILRTTLRMYGDHTLSRAYKGETYFWSFMPMKGDNITFHFSPPVLIERLSAKAFPRKPFRKPLPQGLHRKAFYELPHRQGLNDESAKAFPRKLFRKPLPKGLHRKAFHELPHRQGLNNKSAKAFPRKPFRKPFPQGLHRKAFYELPHRQGLNNKSAKAFPRKLFRKQFPQN
ncbi:Alpha-1,3-mannosyl-glycoprotein 4-beta-N-acetylglucosaminyltransferase A [Araneus ventricosus]|uniref:Alpha-1,3-mannosyl-glycoprotein 4-beta-N-acetylglucosaminyltransferase A n=1 Tax=Araneus ventricosus TaxID=182803 RepID=A0A4Y2J3K3_ARAVE|nr:Alpha-1,3-mannosyl-glycoprotein 4-beta-N-acetylglucosaminyltransferase A [Araneus ventricosus]